MPDYGTRYPLGVQTVVKDDMWMGNKTFQVNTRIEEGWWITGRVLQKDIKKVLKEQALRFETTYQKDTDSKYVKNYY